MPSGIWLYSYLALWLLLLLESALLIGMIRQVAQLHAHWVRNDPVTGLPLGAKAPALRHHDIAGRAVSLGSERGRKTLLLFLSPGCRSCREAIERIGSLLEFGKFEIVLAVGASVTKTRLFVMEYDSLVEADVPVIADAERELSDRYRVGAVPYIVLIDEDGRIGGKGVGLSVLDAGVLVTQADELRRKRLGLPEMTPTDFDAAEKEVAMGAQPARADAAAS
jgi:methylamine dehydrogenase accessory protein MauD